MQPAANGADGVKLTKGEVDDAARPDERSGIFEAKEL